MIDHILCEYSKDTTESNTSASYLDLLVSIWRDGQLLTSLYDKRDDFNFHITNSPFLSSNIPYSPAYGVFMSQLIRYARACSSNECFILRAAWHSCKLIQLLCRDMSGNVWNRPSGSSLVDMGIKRYEVHLSQMSHDILGHYHIQWHPPLIRHFTLTWLYYRTRPYYSLWRHYLIPGGFHRTFATGAASQQRTLIPSDTWSCPILDLHLF